MGKTLLLSHFSREIVASGALVHVLQCSSYNNSTEWFPVLTWFEAQMGTGVSDPAPLRWAALQRFLQSEATADDAALLAQRLSIALPEQAATLPNVTPAVARARTEALACRCLALPRSDVGVENDAGADPAPTVVVIEDVHWADPSTLAFIDALLAHPVHVVVTHRPEFTLPARTEGVQPSFIRLTEIKGAQASDIARGVASGKLLPEAIVERIVKVTDGNPFFIAEYTRAVLNSGRLIEREDAFELVGELPPGLIPNTLRDSLTARLDQLGAARYVARYAAVLGRRFDVAVLQAVVPDGAAHVVACMRELVASGLVRPCDGATETAGDYEFQHALVQVAAYESMLRRERENMHARVASRLDAVFPAWAERQPALVARHLTESRQWLPAAQRWLAAALRSLGSCAYAESIAQANEGLALIRHLEGEAAAGMELALRSILGPALIATTGFASDAVGQTYARAEALCTVVGDKPEAFPSLWGNWVYNLVSARLDVSLGYAQRMHAMGTACGASGMLVEACWTRGDTICGWVNWLRLSTG
jgi:hypothetical protein